jgi:DNA-binding transcriptional MerR regulator
MMVRMYRIQEFAERAGVTVRALHHYDRLGLLKPSERSALGHRRYAERDLQRLQQIVTLKFVGFSLRQIGEMLGRRPFDLRSALRLQLELIRQKRRYMDAAIRAIEGAERAAAAGIDPDPELLKNIVEAIEMQNNVEWMKKYHTPEQLEDLAKRGDPETLRRGEQDWAALIKDVESSLDEDPASEKAQALVHRWMELIHAFTGGDSGIEANLRRLYSDQANWPSTFKRPYGDDVGEFIARARAARDQDL